MEKRALWIIRDLVIATEAGELTETLDWWKETHTNLTAQIEDWWLRFGHHFTLLAQKPDEAEIWIEAMSL